MPAPALDKTYDFDVQNTHTATASALLDHQTVLLALKDSLKATGTVPWVVKGSHDGAGVLGNNDDVDRWAATSDVVFASSGNRSWIVVQQSAINTNTQVCFFCNSTQSDGRGLEVVFSPVAGFFAANGGTDGTATARPTATDEVVLLDSSYGNGVWLDDQTTAQDYYWHVMTSTDGEVTFWAVCRNNQLSNFFMCMKPKNPHADWSDPAVACFRGADGGGGSTNPSGYATLNDNEAVKTNISGVGAVDIRCTTEMAVSSMLGQQTTQTNINGEWPLAAIGMRGVTTGARGHLGILYDMRFTSTARPDGSTYPGAGDAVPESTWAGFGNVALPWNTDTPVLVG